MDLLEVLIINWQEEYGEILTVVCAQYEKIGVAVVVHSREGMRICTTWKQKLVP